MFLMAARDDGFSRVVPTLACARIDEQQRS